MKVVYDCTLQESSCSWIQFNNSTIFFWFVFDYVLAGTTVLNSWSHLVFFLPRLEQERVFQLYCQCGGQSQCRKVSEIELLVQFIDHRCLCCCGVFYRKFYGPPVMLWSPRSGSVFKLKLRKLRTPGTVRY
jgi:hypothetical protein